ncbi:MAG: hypothetical protein HS111_12885 [Kofleriaceae bacterium]|nr:hypothetical protein [Kofleriaceae bacterium]
MLAILDERAPGSRTVSGKDATELQSLATAAQWIAFVAKRDGETKAAPTPLEARPPPALAPTRSPTCGRSTAGMA